MGRSVDPAYLAYQYSSAERLNIRLETHQRYSERRDDFVEWVLGSVEIAPGDAVVDVGCGTGEYHPSLAARQVRVIAAIDHSPGMVRETQQRADQHRLPVVALQANAERLPLPDDAYDVALANHMLYHVADQTAALREIARVLKPAGGRLIAATNASMHHSQLRQMLSEAARALGYTPADVLSDRFNLDEHLGLMESVFPRVERRVREDAFVFRSAEPAVRYLASGPVDAIVDRPADGSHRAPLLALVREQLDAVIARDGVLRDPKTTGCFVAFTDGSDGA